MTKAQVRRVYGHGDVSIFTRKKNTKINNTYNSNDDIRMKTVSFCNKF